MGRTSGYAPDPVDANVVRNLEQQLHENEADEQPSRVGALVLASLGGACIVFAAVLLFRSPPKAKVVNTDPLGDLVAQARPAAPAAPPAPDGVGQEVTFPGLLSDAKRPTTALEGARDPRPLPPGLITPTGMPAAPGMPASTGLALPPGVPFEVPSGAPTTPPPPTDRLPVTPLPAQNVLQGSPSDPPPGDTLANMARAASKDTGGETAPAGTPGGFQLQVSSFKTQPEADAFAAALRRRGHKAYVEPAQVKGRGLWYRVRVGPFKYKHSAVIYRQEFEAKERMVTFIVDPPKPGGGDKPSARVIKSDDDE
jgi:cell division septation protein DedD